MNRIEDNLKRLGDEARIEDAKDQEGWGTLVKAAMGLNGMWSKNINISGINDKLCIHGYDCNGHWRGMTMEWGRIHNDECQTVPTFRQADTIPFYFFKYIGIHPSSGPTVRYCFKGNRHNS